MKVEVKFFALAQQQAGRESLEMELAESATVADLRRQIASSIPELADLLDHTMIAVNHKYVANEEILSDGAEVAIIPPVSGG